MEKKNGQKVIETTEITVTSGDEDETANGMMYFSEQDLDQIGYTLDQHRG